MTGLKVAGAAMLLALLAACGSSIHSGTVQRKQYTAAHEITVEVPQYRFHEVCTFTSGHENCYPQEYVAYYLPVQEHVGPQWQLLVTNGSDKGWVTVSRVVDATTDVGQYWTDAS